MDDTDKHLISLLQEGVEKDGKKKSRMSLSDIGKRLGMSHVAVSKRLDKLVQSDTVRITAGVNAQTLDVKVLFMGIETDNLEVVDRIKEKYKDCPRLLMLAPVTGRYNIFAVMIAEDTWSLESIIGTCSMRTEEGVRRSESWFGNAPIKPEFLEINLAPHHTKGSITPCERDCTTCRRYVENKCVGCPPTTSYKGTLWASPVAKKSRRTKSKS
ncbi:MAG: Lrp/AsnC family transcriptional regulator [Candidatus Thorarchaeota archaeon]